MKLLMLAVIAATLCDAAIRDMPPPPAGFTAIGQSSSTAAMKAKGVADVVEAEKPNDGWPGCMVDPKIHFKYGWMALAWAGQTVEMMAQTPEEPAARKAGTLDEPDGKKRHKNGVLTWRKRTTMVAGASARCNEVVMHAGSWVGYVSGKLISVEVHHLYQAKGAGQGWIDEYVDRVIAVVTGPQ